MSITFISNSWYLVLLPLTYAEMFSIVFVLNRICLYVYVYLPDSLPASVFVRAIAFEPLDTRNFISDTQIDTYLQYLA